MAPAAKRSEFLRVRMARTEREGIRRRARQYGISVSDLVRWSALGLNVAKLAAAQRSLDSAGAPQASDTSTP